VPRIIALPRLGDSSDAHHLRTLMLSEDLVRAHIDLLFPGMTVLGVFQFRLLRGAVQDQGMPVGRHMALARQKAWPVVRIDVEQDMPDWVLRWLQENLEAGQACVLRRKAPLGIGSLAAEWAERIPEM
jgi:polyphosphate kinase